MTKLSVIQLSVLYYIMVSYRLVAPLVLVDLEAKGKYNRDYLVSEADITSWEEQYGTIKKGSVVSKPSLLP